MTKNFVVGIDLGGTKISGAFTDLEGNVLYKHTIPTNAFEGEKAVLDRIITVIKEVIKESGHSIEDVKAIGVGSPGPLDPKKGEILQTPNLPFENFQLIKPIQEKFDIPTFLDNDANVATIGEHLFGAGIGTKNMIFVTVSTGVGAGAIINGKIFRGNTFNALEVGHASVDKDGPMCKCGNRGCVEVYSSGTAIGRIANEAILEGKETSLTKYKTVTAKEVFIEAKSGDNVANEVLDFSLNYLGICISNLIVTFDPEMIVIGGGVSMAGEIVFNKINEVVKERCFKEMAAGCRIVPAGLGTDAGMIGAAALAITESE
ncbi:ROK family protein [Clostridium grantii]|uniref:Glucokinase n=1 Tax=Clostridium grantii DSM 8605 TaxID=1121316 RepID=A0A1M5WJM4_9CLOT|nr:ROK family protein [Clostridium grantii]SHH87705.1 glucokinase [Clostridium grantii DSM 8605]